MIKELNTISISGDRYSGKYFFKILSLDWIHFVKGLAISKIVRGETRITQITKSKKYRIMLLIVDDRSLVPIFSQIISLTGGAY